MKKQTIIKINNKKNKLVNISILYIP